MQLMHCLLVFTLHPNLALAFDQESVEADNAAFCGMSLRQGRRHKVPLLQTDVFPARLAARLTIARVVVQMEDRAVCTVDVELLSVRYGSKSIMIAVRCRKAACVQLCGCL